MSSFEALNTAIGGIPSNDRPQGFFSCTHVSSLKQETLLGSVCRDSITLFFMRLMASELGMTWADTIAALA
jgi:hypothetical protein